MSEGARVLLRPRFLTWLEVACMELSGNKMSVFFIKAESSNIKLFGARK